MPAPTLEAWTYAVQANLDRAETIEEMVNTGTQAGEVKVTKTLHPSDPPKTTNYYGRQRRPGSLPVLLAEVPKDAAVEAHEHKVVGEANLEHMAALVVTEARRIRAKAIVLSEPRLAGDATVFPVTNVSPHR